MKTPHPIELLEARIAPATLHFANPTTATYTDADGDKVTVKFTKPILSEANVGHVLVTVEIDATHDQLQTIDLTAGDIAVSPKGTGITVTAKPAPLPANPVPIANAGDGLAHIGYIKATGFDLGVINIHGDLGAIDAGDATVTTMAITKLTVQSLGVFALTTGAPDLESDIVGSMGAFTVLTNVHNAEVAITGTGAKLTSLTIGGSLTGDNAVANAGSFDVAGNLGTVFVGGDVIGGAGQFSGFIGAGGTLGNVTVGGSVKGGAASHTGEIRALGASIGVVKIGGDVKGGTGVGTIYSGVIDSAGSIKSATVGGSLLGGAGGDSGEIFALGGAMGTVKIALDVVGGSGTATSTGLIGSLGKLGAVTIGRDLIGGSGFQSGLVTSRGDMAMVTVLGSIKGGAGGQSGLINSDAKLAGVKVTGSVLGGTGIDSGQIESDLDMGAITIGGDLRGADATGMMTLFCSGFITSTQKIKSVTIGGSIISGVNNSTNPLFDDGAIRAGDDLGAVVVKGSLIGNSSNPVLLTGRGQAKPGGTDLAIASVTVTGRAEYANILAGYNHSFAPTPENGDAQIGAIKVGGDWIASNAVAGAQNLGTDDLPNGMGTAADNVNFGDAHDSPFNAGKATIASKIASITIGGLIKGTASGVNATDHFGFVAEQIGAFTIAGVPIPLFTGPHNDNRTLGLTSDVTIHESQF